MKYVYYIADNKMFRFCHDGKNGNSEPVEITSGILTRYQNRVRESARRSEWKSSGEGAAFIGTNRADSDPESRVLAIRSAFYGLEPHGGRLYYSLSIDNSSGIYTKKTLSDDNEGIMISDSEYSYREFAIKDDRAVVSAAFAGEVHLGIVRLGGECSFFTEGTSREISPSWSECEPDVIYYSSAGLATSVVSEKTENKLTSLPDAVLSQIKQDTYIEGPYSIYRADIKNFTLSDILTDEKMVYSFIKPYMTANGNLYYIKRPYKYEQTERGGCLDLFLAPFRFFGAIFGFMNFFTMKYSGKTMTKGGVKSREMSERQVFIDGNLFNAEKELKENKDKGEKFPGVVPRSFCLCRRAKDGEEIIVKRGIISYSVECIADGEETVYCSNGSYLLKLSKDGEEKLLKASGVSFIKSVQ